MSLVKDMSEMLVNERVSDELKAKRLAICESAYRDWETIGRAHG